MKLTRALVISGVAAGGMLLALGSPASAGTWCDGDDDDWDDNDHVVIYNDYDYEYEEDNETAGLLALDLL